MPVAVQGPDGNTYQFPDGTDKAAAIGYFKKKGINGDVIPPTSGPIPGVDAHPQPVISKESQNKQALMAGFRGVGKEFAETANTLNKVNPMEAFSNTKKPLIDVNTNANDRDEKAGKFVGGALESMVPVGAAGDIAKGALGVAGKGATVAAKVTGFPSRNVGAELFKDVMAHAENVPVTLTRSGDAVLRAKEIADAGTSMPQAVNKLLRRVTDPEKPPPTYAEMRDFYTNISSLSANEMSRISAPMKRQIGIIAKGLKDDIGDAADQAGQASKYYAAMKNYSQASKLLRASHTMAKWGLGLAGADAAYRGYETIKTLGK